MKTQTDKKSETVSEEIKESITSQAEDMISRLGLNIKASWTCPHCGAYNTDMPTCTQHIMRKPTKVENVQVVSYFWPGQMICRTCGKGVV